MVTATDVAAVIASIFEDAGRAGAIHDTNSSTTPVRRCGVWDVGGRYDGDQIRTIQAS